MSKIERSKVVELVEKSGEWIGCEGSGTGTDWDLLSFENEVGEKLSLTHFDDIYYINRDEVNYEQFVEIISNL